MRFSDRILVVRAPLVAAPYGGQDYDWANAVATGPYAAEVQPLSSSEDVVLQDRTVTRWRLILIASADLVYTDRVRWDGVDYDVDGDVERHKFRGVLDHLEAVLQRVSGG